MTRLAAAAALTTLALLLPRAADAFGFNSVVALVVADGVTTYPGAVRVRPTASGAPPPAPACATRNPTASGCASGRTNRPFVSARTSGATPR